MRVVKTDKMSAPLQLGVEGEVLAPETPSKKKSKKVKEKRERKAKGKRQKNSGVTAGTVVGIIFTFLFSAAAIFGILYLLFVNFVQYPPAPKIDYQDTGAYALDLYVSEVHQLSEEAGGYLNQELKYANGDVDIQKLMSKLAGTVNYIPNVVEDVDIFGNPRIDRGTDGVATRNSYVSYGEAVILQYVDYENIPLDVDKISEILIDDGVSLSSIDYQNALVGVLCRYLLAMESLPVTENREYVPNLTVYIDEETGEERFAVDSESEGIYLDKLIFSSPEFFDFLERFSDAAMSATSPNPAYTVWEEEYRAWETRKAEIESKLAEMEANEGEIPKDAEGNITSEELIIGEAPVAPPLELPLHPPLEEWSLWNDLSPEEKVVTIEPQKYEKDHRIAQFWCGAYYLQHEYTEIGTDGTPVVSPVAAKLGDGTKANPAAIGTPVITYSFIVDSAGATRKVPIRVTLVEYGVSQDAIDWLEWKDVRNRGFDVKSEVQYIYLVFEVENLSDIPLAIWDNFTLADANANNSIRTGQMYGLEGKSVVLAPHEVGTVETWSMSTELNLKYAIWGASFARREAPVWFRILAGDLEDESYEKGVTLNTTRGGQG